ncbi:MAG: bestrophin family ion channel [Archangium sp.]|nr:bestrophin family ion channel [Archangium sp.]
MIDYDPHKWRTTFFAIKGSMIRVISIRSLYVTLGAIALTVIHFHVRPLEIANAGMVHTMVGTALGLLLVFRTNQSYDRWWEGRKLWGAMVNTCRNLARSTSIHLAHDPERLRRVLRLTQAFPAAATCVLRQQAWAPVGLEPDDVEAITSHNHMPTAIAQRITFHLEAERKGGRLADIVFTSIDHNNQQLVDIIGACERIHKTPLPFAYVVHLRRALVLYCATLPVALVQSFGWATVPIVYGLTYVMLGIEEIGVEIEDPFEGDDNDLPLERITDGIQHSVASFLPPE